MMRRLRSALHLATRMLRKYPTSDDEEAEKCPISCDKEAKEVPYI